MITRLQIRNFQCHKRLDLDLDPGVNAIVGASDSGKSAIIRALYWLCFNEPAGASFRSHWGGRCVVMAHLDDDRVIKRVRTKNENYYQIGDKKLKAFGRGVPPEIVEALNLDELNFHRQLDPPFLLAETPSQVAKRLNQIANLESIDQAISYVTGVIRAAQNEIRSEEARHASFVEDLTEFDDLDDRERLVEKAEMLLKRQAGLLQKRTKILSATSELQRCSEALTEVENKTKGKDLVERALVLFEAKKEIGKKSQKIEYLIKHVRHLKEDRKRTLARGAEIKADLAEILDREPCPLCGRSRGDDDETKL